MEDIEDGEGVEEEINKKLKKEDKETKNS